MIRVVIADDNPVLRLGIISHLELCDDIEVIGEAADGEAAIEEVHRQRPDVLLLDMRMPRLDGLGVLERLESTAVLVLTNSDDPETIRAALRLGATGYLVFPHTDAPDIDQAIRRVARGETVLGSRAAQQLVDLLPDASRPAVPRSRPPDERARRFHLSTREVEVLDLVALGYANDEIAEQLFISAKTVKNHLNRVFAKLHASSRAEATAIWRGERGPP